MLAWASRTAGAARATEAAGAAGVAGAAVGNWGGEGWRLNAHSFSHYNLSRLSKPVILPLIAIFSYVISDWISGSMEHQKQHFCVIAWGGAGYETSPV